MLETRLRSVPPPAFGDIIGPWRFWFAWHPVRSFDGCWRWGRYVWRRRCQLKAHLPGSLSQWWQYE